MDDEKIVDVTQVTQKQPWYKRAWKNIKKGWSKFVDWLEEWWDDVIFPILAVVWAFTIGFIYGKLFGLWDKDNNRAYYEAGSKNGFKDGYEECVSNLKSSGYQVYGGYGEDSDKMIVNKIVETVKEEQEV